MLPIQFLKKENEKGQGLVEYAIVLPIFLMLVFFIIDFSTILADKVAFNMALRDAIFDIEFKENEVAQLKGYLNPFGPVESRYSPGYNRETNELQNRGKDFYMNQPFLDGLTVADYLKKEIKARDKSINVDNIDFVNFDGDRESKIGIYSGLQHYHYQKDYGADGKNYETNTNISTIIVSQIRVKYTIEPKGGFMKTLYPDGIPHEKVIYKTSRNFRWRPNVINPHVPDELESMKNAAGGV